MNLNEVEQEKRWQHNCCKDKEHNVRLCKADNIKIDEEFVVNYIDLGKQIIIVASGSTVSLAGNDWLVLYFKEFELEIGEMKNMSCRQSFRFRPGKRYVSMEMIKGSNSGGKDKWIRGSIKGPNLYGGCKGVILTG